MRTAPYEDEPSAGDDRMRGARDMKVPIRWAMEGEEGEEEFMESAESSLPSSISEGIERSGWSNGGRSRSELEGVV